MKEYWIKWIKAAGVRAVKTMAQTAIASIGTAVIISAADWRVVLSASLMAGILSLLTSLAGLPEVSKPEAKDPLADFADELCDLGSKKD